jgi:hypothetical protein
VIIAYSDFEYCVIRGRTLSRGGERMNLRKRQYISFADLYLLSLIALTLAIFVLSFFR